MTLSISKTGKNPGGRPKTDATPIMVRVHPPELSSLDAYIAAQPDPKPSRPEAIRALLREGLTGKGLMPPNPVAIEEKIETLEADLAAHPPIPGRSPKGALRMMKRAVTENELVELRLKRKRLGKAKGK